MQGDINLKGLFTLYPEVATCTVNGEAFDRNGQQVEVDMAAIAAWRSPDQYKEERAAAYPPAADFLDGYVKGDQAQIDKYVADCLAVKAKYPKPQ